jgi:hypothetical protein
MTRSANLDVVVDDLRERVLGALDSKDVLPKPEVFRRTLLRVMSRGEKCREEFLLPIIGKAAWQDVSRRLNCSDSRLAAILGFGEAMTEFLVAGIPASTGSRPDVIRIGALAKFIISIYDKLVDDVGERELLPRGELIRAMNGSSAPRRTTMPADPSRRVIMKAVSAYFRLLHLLPFAKRRERERRMLGKAIVELFDVELRLRPDRRGTAGVREDAVKAKAAFSFISMGLPAWLASPRPDPEALSWHWNWLGELGEFLGWVDDLMDVEEDVGCGFPNRVVMRLQRPNGRRPQALRSLAEEIATLASDLVDQWNCRLSTAGTHRNALNCFKTNILSWLGGPRDPAIHSLI